MFTEAVNFTENFCVTGCQKISVKFTAY